MAEQQQAKGPSTWHKLRTELGLVVATIIFTMGAMLLFADLPKSLVIKIMVSSFVVYRVLVWVTKGFGRVS